MKASLLFLLLCTTLAAAALEGGSPLIDPAQLLPGKLQSYGAQRSVQPSNHDAFAHGLRIVVAKQPPNTWDAAVGARTTAPVKKGDAVLASFWARGKAAKGTGGGVTEFVFEKASPPHTKSVQYLVETPVDGSWRHFQVRFISQENYAAGAAKIAFQSGYLAARLELGGLSVTNYGKRPLNELPHTALTYVGREADAAWRKEAAQRIEQHRKAGITVTVKDKAGNPKAGVPVRIHMDRLDFDLGSAVKVNALVGESPDDARYREVFLKHFNLGVIENGLKWKQWDAWRSNRKKALQALDWLQEQGVPARGHVMVWPGARYLPPAVKELYAQPDALRAAIDARIAEIGAAAGERVRDWDVLNEVYDNRDLTRILGDAEMIRWFKLAKQAAPHAKTYYNDYAGLVRGGFNTGHKDHFEQTLRFLVDQGAPIDGIGIQGHFGALLTPPHRLYAELDRWAAIGPPIKITEFDVTVPDPKLRGDFTRDFITLCFSHPKVTGVVSWGFWAGSMWRPESALFTKDWTPTPMGREWIRLVLTWKTDETVNTDAKGQVQLRGFRGDYTISAGDTTVSSRLGAEGLRMALTLP